MKNLRSMLRLLSCLFLIAFVLPVRADSLNDLKESFKKRYPELQAMKSAGAVGETSEGKVEAVKPGEAGEAVKALVASENADRTKLYAALSAQQGIDKGLVAERNAKRNFEKANAGEWLKYPEGWKKK